MSCWCHLNHAFFRRQFGGDVNRNSSSNNSGNGKCSPQKTAAAVAGLSSGESAAGVEATRMEATLMEAKPMETTSTASNLSLPNSFLLPQFSEQSIIAGDIRKFVRLPPFVTRDEWLASHGNGISISLHLARSI
jgi:hypothetical protein